MSTLSFRQYNLLPVNADLIRTLSTVPDAATERDGRIPMCQPLPRGAKIKAKDLPLSEKILSQTHEHSILIDERLKQLGLGGHEEGEELQISIAVAVEIAGHLHIDDGLARALAIGSLLVAAEFLVQEAQLNQP